MPLEQIVSDGVHNSADVGVLATRTEKGRVDILLWHYRDDDLPGPDAAILLSLTALDPGRHYQAHVWRIDRHNGDAFTAWMQMGAPTKPTPQQIATLAHASRMTARAIPITPISPDGSVTLRRDLPLQGVELIEVELR